MYKYKTKDGQDVTVPGVGRSVNGILMSSFKIENPNLELVTEEQEATPPASTYMNGVAPQSAQPTPPPATQPAAPAAESEKE